MFEITRRHFLSKFSAGIGGAALASLLPQRLMGADHEQPSVEKLLAHHAPKAKRIIYLFMSGGPAQQDLFDYKPKLNELNGEELPDEVRNGQRLTGMSGNQSSLPLAGSQFEFKRHGKSGAWVSELLPHTAEVVDELCFIKSMWTEAINHDPAMTFFQTGSQIAGRPSMGSWVTYGLGSMNENLPSFVVLATKKPTDQPLYARLWGNGFLDSRYQGVRFTAGDDPVFYLTNPDGVCRSGRRALLDKLSDLNRLDFQNELDPEIESRVAQYEMAFRMQTSIPEVTDLSKEPESVKALYGEEVNKPGTFAANCLLARRLAENGVRFIQLYHPGWDQHNNAPDGLKRQTKETDQGCAALIKDLKQRGLLEDTLVVWGGEFGRTSYSQGKLTKTNYGRDHHPRCFTAWMAGAGVKAGHTYGQTDDYGYNILGPDGMPILKPSKDGDTPGAIHVHDLHATILHQLGIDHTRLTHTFQGRRYRLTDVHGHVVKDLLA
ncbi:MAG: DUF1501 domain-containing protein [Akkermansiaceae bacterium]|nr:DUF1501 domain-containing protein [Akkermansiaceae bacterium]